jgi:UDP-N-acetylmuramoylalanine--D-glutamate ligase
MMNEWLGRRVGVYGYGRTGRACVEFLLPHLLNPVVLVDGLSAEQQAAYRAEAAGRFEFAFDEEIAQQLPRLDSLVLSPGVPLANPSVRAATERGIPVLSELELAYRYCPGYIVAVTGTNGKSTTTKMLGHVLSALGPTHVLGNIGTPLIANLGTITQDDFVALEVSSFQLEAVDRFAPRIAVFTNLTPDHLDRHGTITEYARLKRRMTDRMERGSFVVTNAMCPEFSPERFTNQDPVFLQYRSTPGNRLHGAWVANRQINVDLGAEQWEIPLECIKLPGWHNVENALAVIIAALLVGASPEIVAERLATFTGYEHRIELCRREAGVAFYNDSKATNPEATITALKAMDGPLALILGGRDKMTDLSEMAGWVKRKAVHVVLIGEAAGRFEQALREAGYNSSDFAAGLEDAVPKALVAVRASGGRVLLSPGCASFDQYSGYEARGDHFKAIVASLAL